MNKTIKQRIMENKLNKYGCRPSGDVCLEHDSPLITFGICEDSPELKDFIQQIRQDTLRQVLMPEEYVESLNSDKLLAELYNNTIKNKAKEIWGLDI